MKTQAPLAPQVLAAAYYDGIAASYKPVRASLPTTIRYARLPVARRFERRAYWAGRAADLPAAAGRCGGQAHAPCRACP